MAQNITLLGASYADVPAVTLPKTGGGTATFTDVSPTTAGAADVASGKLFFDALGVLTQGTASGGGGGASNVVTGTFKGTTGGVSLVITIPYSGSGYPVACIIYPSEGVYNSDTGTFYNLVQQYAIAEYVIIKNNTTTPTYASSGESNRCSVFRVTKSSASSATSYTSGNYFGSSGKIVLTDSIASSTNGEHVKFRSATTMSVRIVTSGNYGFAANIEYTYCVIYSS